MRVFAIALFAILPICAPSFLFAEFPVFMPIGDSITAGFHGSPAGSYRDELQKLFDLDGMEYDFVGDYQRGFLDRDHQGLPGASIQVMTNTFGPTVALHKPDFALVLAGTNNHWSDPNLEDFVELYEGLIEMIQDNSPETSIIISTVPKFGYQPPAGTNYWTESWVDNRNDVVFPNMNSAIEIVAANHANVTVVDLYPQIDLATDFAGSNGVHMNLYGQQKLANLFHAEISSQLSAVPEPKLGDVNLDGVVDFLDIPPFISALSSGVFQAEADCDESCAVDFLDISTFVSILSGS